jgi:hypothetical protein
MHIILNLLLLIYSYKFLNTFHVTNGGKKSCELMHYKNF